VRRACLAEPPPVPKEGAGEPTEAIATPDGRVVECPPEFEGCYQALSLALADEWNRAIWRWAEKAWSACGPEEGNP